MYPSQTVTIKLPCGSLFAVAKHELPDESKNAHLGISLSLVKEEDATLVLQHPGGFMLDRDCFAIVMAYMRTPGKLQLSTNHNLPPEKLELLRLHVEYFLDDESLLEEDTKTALVLLSRSASLSLINNLPSVSPLMPGNRGMVADLNTEAEVIQRMIELRQCPLIIQTILGFDEQRGETPDEHATKVLYRAFDIENGLNKEYVVQYLKKLFR